MNPLAYKVKRTFEGGGQVRRPGEILRDLPWPKQNIDALIASGLIEVTGDVPDSNGSESSGRRKKK